MKKIISILLVVAFAMSLSLTAFAATADTTITFDLTTDVTEVVAGDEVIVTVDATSTSFANTAMVQYSIVYDTANFSVDTAAIRNNGPRYGYNCFDADWWADMGNWVGFGSIEKPTPGENPVGTVNVLFVSTGGAYIDEYSEIYAGGTTTAGKIKFTSLADGVITADSFKLANCKVEDVDGVAFNVKVGGGDEEFVITTPDNEEVTITYPTSAANRDAGTNDGAKPVNYKAYFGKNTTGQKIIGAKSTAPGAAGIVVPTLADGTAYPEYSAVFNGVTFYGKADVEVDQSWVIILVDSTGEILDAEGNLK